MSILSCKTNDGTASEINGLFSMWGLSMNATFSFSTFVLASDAFLISSVIGPASSGVIKASGRPPISFSETAGLSRTYNLLLSGAIDGPLDKVELVFGKVGLVFSINGVLLDLLPEESLVITQVTVPTKSRRNSPSQRPYHFLRVCKTLLIPLQTFSDGNILYWSAFCFINCSKSLLLKLLSITSYYLNHPYPWLAAISQSISCFGF